MVYIPEEASRIMYKIADEKTIRETFCRDSGMYFILVQSLFFLFLPTIVEYILNRSSDNVYYIIGMLLVRILGLAGLSLALYLLIIFPSQSIKQKITEVSIKDDRIIVRSLNGLKEYPFDMFCDNISVHLGFKDSSAPPPVLSKFTSLEDFLTNAFSEIEENLKEPLSKTGTEKKIIINFYKKGKHILILAISPSLIGGLESIKKFLEDWKAKYEEYCEREGVEKNTSVH